MTSDRTRGPRLAGWRLRALVALAEARLTRDLIARRLLARSGVTALREVEAGDPPPEAPPIFALAERAAVSEVREPEITAISRSDPAAGERSCETVADFRAAYREGRKTPNEVADWVLTACADSDAMRPPLRAFVAQDERDLRRMAAASTGRWRSGEPMGPLDGVPVAVGDELDQRGHGTTAGTRFLGRRPATHDATAVARLRVAGALLIGKCNMQELGLGLSGHNPNHGQTRNPNVLSRQAGGSSSGAAAAVAAGLCPIALGTDSGGSIRVPAALCGVVGLKPTYGRVSAAGSVPICVSLDHVGPIAATARDAALAYRIVAGPDPEDPRTAHQPPVHLHELDAADLRGLRLGIYRAWFEHAEAPVVAACRAAAERLEAAGAELVEIELPDLALARVVLLVTRGSEIAASRAADDPVHRKDYGHDTRLSLALARALTAADYEHGQRLRQRLFRSFEAAFGSVHAILSPTTGRVAPEVTEDGRRTGVVDPAAWDPILRFVLAPNLTGHPAITFPVGYEHGAPIGMQAIGRAWCEDVLLRIAASAEEGLERVTPHAFWKLLSA